MQTSAAVVTNPLNFRLSGHTNVITFQCSLSWEENVKESYEFFFESSTTEEEKRKSRFLDENFCIK